MVTWLLIPACLLIDDDHYARRMAEPPSDDTGQDDTGEPPDGDDTAVTPQSAEMGLEDADVTWTGADDYENAGLALAPLGDTNGDGHAELAIGVPWARLDGETPGAVWLLFGPDQVDKSFAAAEVVLSGDLDGSYAGGALAAPGDLDEDGYADLLVRAPYDSALASYGGAAYLVAGPVTASMGLKDAQAALYGGIDGHGAGQVLCPATGLDGDGGAGVAVAAPNSAWDGKRGPAISLFYAPFSGAGVLEDAASAQIVAEYGQDWFGQSMAGGADLDGDGVGDLLVGYPADSTTADDGGSVLVFFGPVTGSVTPGDAAGRIAGAQAGDALGYAVTVAQDLDGDGLADVVAGAPQVGTGGSGKGLAVRFGSVAGLAGDWSADDALARLVGDEEPGLLGIALARGGDTDGDGEGEVLVGAPAARGYAGAAYLVEGDQEGTIAAADARRTLNGAWEAGYASWSVAGDFDWNADGLGDLVIGAPMAGHTGYAAGAAYLVLGR